MKRLPCDHCTTSARLRTHTDGTCPSRLSGDGQGQQGQGQGQGGVGFFVFISLALANSPTRDATFRFTSSSPSLALPSPAARDGAAVGAVGAGGGQAPTLPERTAGFDATTTSDESDEDEDDEFNSPAASAFLRPELPPEIRNTLPCGGRSSLFVVCVFVLHK